MCMVQGFTVGRRGFGQVHFPGKTDVYGLNLDELGKFFSIVLEQQQRRMSLSCNNDTRL